MRYRVVCTIQYDIDIPRELTEREQETLRSDVAYGAGQLSDMHYCMDQLVGLCWNNTETVQVSMEEIRDNVSP